MPPAPAVEPAEVTIDLDNVLNALQDVANAVGMYNIQESTVEGREMAALAAGGAPDPVRMREVMLRYGLVPAAG